MNEKFLPSLTISFFRGPDGENTSLINWLLQKYVLLKNESEEGLQRGFSGCGMRRNTNSSQNFFSPSTEWSTALKGYYVCRVGCTMHFQGIHRVQPKSGWLLSYSQKAVLAAMAKGFWRF